MQALLAKGHEQRREQGDAELLGELLDRRNDGGIARGDGEDLAFEVVGREQPQHSAATIPPAVSTRTTRSGGLASSAALSSPIPTHP